jgi:hypothetical protein
MNPKSLFYTILLEMWRSENQKVIMPITAFESEMQYMRSVGIAQHVREEEGRKCGEEGLGMYLAKPVVRGAMCSGQKSLS